MPNDSWTIDIYALSAEARDVPSIKIAGYGTMIYQNVEKGSNYTIKLGCDCNEGDARYFIHADVVVMVSDGCEELDFKGFEGAYRLVKALRQCGFHLSIWGPAIQGHLEVEPKNAQSRLDVVRSMVERLFGTDRPTAPLRSIFSYGELEWDIDEIETGSPSSDEMQNP